MSKSLLSEDQIATGYDRFLAGHPDVILRLNALTQAIADILGVELGELRRIETAKALSESAASHGIDSFEYLLRFAVDTESELEHIMQARRKLLERAIGLR